MFTGHRVLLASPDQIVAGEVARALQAVSAVIMGPCPTEQAALDELVERRPDVAVIDLDIHGSAFALAQMLADHGIPSVFMADDHPRDWPPELARVERLAKPVAISALVNAISKAVAGWR